MPGLGRLYSPDERDEGFRMEAVVPKETTRRWRYWYQGGWWGDQGNTPQCVAYAWLHLLEDAPILYPDKTPILNPRWLYCEAQKVDVWPGDCENLPHYDGTSVRAGAKVLQDLGYISEYRWAWDVDTVIRCLLETGTVVMGTWWYEDMFFAPSSREPVKVSGRRAGGHAYKLDGVNLNQGVVRAKNSWGNGWGHYGRFFITFEDLDRLIREDGEACMPVEVGMLNG